MVHVVFVHFAVVRVQKCIAVPFDHELCHRGMEPSRCRSGSRVPEVPLHPRRQTHPSSIVVREVVKHAGHVRGFFSGQPLAVRQIAGRVDLGRRVQRPCHHEGFARRETVIDHRRNVDDRDIRYRQLPAEFGAGVVHVLGRRVARVCGSNGSDDLLVRRAIIMIDDAAAWMRAVDDPVPTGCQQRGHQRNAVCCDGAIGGSRPVALPGRRIEHHLAFIRGVGQRARVVVGLRTPDGDSALIEVVIPQHLVQSRQCGLACDE